MALNESTFEIETGLFRPIWTSVVLTPQLKVDIPSLEYESFRTGEAIELFSFSTRKRNSSRQIVGKCAMGSSCSNNGNYLEGEYFNPKTRQALFITTHFPFVALHSIGSECSEFSTDGDEVIKAIIAEASIVPIVEV